MLTWNAFRSFSWSTVDGIAVAVAAGMMDIAIGDVSEMREFCYAAGKFVCLSEPPGRLNWPAADCVAAVE